MEGEHRDEICLLRKEEQKKGKWYSRKNKKQRQEHLVSVFYVRKDPHENIS